jgi:hypothetical protein
MAEALDAELLQDLALVRPGAEIKERDRELLVIEARDHRLPGAGRRDDEVLPSLMAEALDAELLQDIALVRPGAEIKERDRERLLPPRSGDGPIEALGVQRWVVQLAGLRKNPLDARRPPAHARRDADTTLIAWVERRRV